jgi:hypothetical protein
VEGVVSDDQSYSDNLEGFNGEAEPRLTSGGEAATLPT